MISHPHLRRVPATDATFDEAAYLDANPDVARAVRAGAFKSGRHHFERFGRNERRTIVVPGASAPRPGSLASLLARLARRLGKPEPGADGRRAAPADSPQEDRRRLVGRYIAGGAGIEIGALHNPLPLPDGVKVSYVDRADTAALRRQYPELKDQPLVAVDIVADGESLAPLGNGSQDFVIANHFLEHCQNPIFALENMLRVLKNGGILFLAVPDKRFSFDCARPATPYRHLEKDYAEGPAGSREQHFREWVRLVEKIPDGPEADRETTRLMHADASIHFHVWTPTELRELILNLKTRLEFEIETMRFADEAVFILRKEKDNHHGH